VLEAAFILGWWGLEPSGLEAAGWVTVILRLLTSAAGFLAVSRSLKLKPVGTRRWVDRTVLSEQLSLGFLSAIQQSLRVVGMLALVGLSTWLLDGARGESVFRALTLWTKIDIPMIMLAMAWGGGGAPIVGMFLGADRHPEAGRAAWSAARIAAGAALVNTALVYFFAPDLIRAFVPNDAAVIADTLVLLDHVAPFYPLVAMGIAIGFVFNGAGDMRRPLFWDLAVLVVVQAGMAALLVGSGLADERGFFVVLAISGVLQGVVPAFFLKRRSWGRRH
jgi:Na+-driven multidrug efflux pump